MVSHFRFGRPLAHSSKKRADQSCSSGGLYKTPTAGQSIPYTTPINITWDTSCLTADYVDIFLYAPTINSYFIHAWQNVYFPTGSYRTNFLPKWWNSTDSANLLLSIVPSNTPDQAPSHPGPLFTVTYQPPSSGGPPAAADTSKPDATVTVVNKTPYVNHTSDGKIAAGVIVPLLVIFLLVAAYVKMKRDRGKEKRKRWSVALDQRMSTISTNWQPISIAGAQTAIRNSIASNPSNRASAFSFANIRPVSTVTVGVESGQAGIGSRSLFPGQSDDTAQLRSSSATSQILANRVSRVSFAPDVRPSSESRRTVTSRAYHTAIVPPLPDCKWESSQPSTPILDHDETWSPTQTDGPQTLSVEDIQARLAGEETTTRASIDAVMPALRLMRTGNPSPTTEGEEGPELLFSAQSTTFPTVPSPVHSPHSPEPASSMSSFMPMHPMPATVMSPDDMLRVYAERRALGSASSVNGPTVPSPIYPGNGAQGGVRTLYSPTRSQKRLTEGSQYSGFADEDAYDGTQ